MDLNTKLTWIESWMLAKVYLRPDFGKVLPLVRAIYLGSTTRGMVRTRLELQHLKLNAVYLVYCLRRSNILKVTVYMTWTSTIFVVAMATYRRTFCWKKRNTVPNTGGAFVVGAIADHGHYRCGAVGG